MLKLDLSGLDAAERFVAGYPNAYWDGWTMVIFNPNPAGASRVDGMFHGGKWGIASRIEPDQAGRYKIRA